MRWVVCGVLSVSLAGVAVACAWDSNTIADELALDRGVELFDLISGQFPHHGDAFYEDQLARGRAALAANPDDWAARNDAAVALMKLRRYDESQVELEALLASDPQRYETLSNLGVLHKKKGEFSEAIGYMERALAIKPEGHMGLGDWYLRMLRYQEARAGGVPQENFLGVAYGAAPWDYPDLAPLLWGVEASELGAEELALQHVLLLIRNDRSFPDSYMVLGDLLRRRERPTLALWAYARARHLGHPNDGAVQGAIDATFESLRDHAKHDSALHYVTDAEDAVPAILADLEQAQSWLEAFQALETERLAAGESTDFDSVLAALAASGVEPLRPSGHAVRSGPQALALNPSPTNLLLLCLGGVFVLYLVARVGLPKLRRAG